MSPELHVCLFTPARQVTWRPFELHHKSLCHAWKMWVPAAICMQISTLLYLLKFFRNFSKINVAFIHGDVPFKVLVVH